MLEGIADTKWFVEEDKSIKNNAAYNKQLLQQQQLFLVEQNKKTEYNAQFQQADISYWSKTINDLNAKAKGTTADAAMKDKPRNFRNGHALTIAGVIATPC